MQTAQKSLNYPDTIVLQVWNECFKFDDITLGQMLEAVSIQYHTASFFIHGGHFTWNTIDDFRAVCKYSNVACTVSC